MQFFSFLKSIFRGIFFKKKKKKEDWSDWAKESWNVLQVAWRRRRKNTSCWFPSITAQQCTWKSCYSFKSKLNIDLSWFFTSYFSLKYFFFHHFQGILVFPELLPILACSIFNACYFICNRSILITVKSELFICESFLLLYNR